MHPLFWVSLIFRDSGCLSSGLAFCKGPLSSLPPAQAPGHISCPNLGIKPQRQHCTPPPASNPMGS